MKFKEHTEGYYLYTTNDLTSLGGKYLSKQGAWYFPKTEDNIKLFQDMGLVPKVKNKKYRLSEGDKAKLPKLYDIQYEAIAFLKEHNGNGLIAYDMGLGKTVISLGYTLLDNKPTIIICQASTKEQWASQIELWTNKTSYIVYGQSYVDIPTVDYIIINYEILQFHKLTSYTQVIIDEVQFIANADSKRSKKVQEMCKDKQVIALSGTPITRRPVQFYPILHILMPKVFNSFPKFAMKYCKPELGTHGWEYNGATNVEHLNKYLGKIMIRRTKEESLDLPEKRVIPVRFDLTEEDMLSYRNDRERIVGVFSDGDYINNKNSLTFLQYLAYIGKRKKAVQWISEFIEIEKLVVFCKHRKTVEDLHNLVPNSVVYYGGMSRKLKKKSLQMFKDEVQLLIGNIQALGTGTDGLQHVCNNVAFIELPWTPAEFNQATDRLWRIGQKNSVNVYTLLAKNTVDENILNTVKKTSGYVNKFIDENKLIKEIVCR